MKAESSPSQCCFSGCGKTTQNKGKYLSKWCYFHGKTTNRNTVFIYENRGDRSKYGRFISGVSPGNKTHGLSETDTYYIWLSMRQRCNNPNSRAYSNYGGRGIKILWKSFQDFVNDMGERPERMTIERIDVNGNYCKENCCWATRKEQNNNRRNNTRITFNGETKTLAQWADAINVKHSTMALRLNYGWSIERALTTPTRYQKI